MAALKPTYELAAKRTLQNQKAPQLTFTANRNVQAACDSGDVLIAHDLIIRGTVTNDAAPAGTVRAGQPWDLMSKVRVNGPGGDIINASGMALSMVSQLRGVRADNVDTISATEAAVGGAAVTFFGKMTVHYVEPKMRPKHHGALATALASQEGAFSVNVECGSGIANLIDGSNAVLGTVTVDVNKRRLEGLQEISRSGYGLHPVLSKTETDAVRTLNAAKPFNLTRGRYLHGLLLILRDGANRNLSDSPLTATGMVRVKVGGNTVFESSVQNLRNMQRDYFPENIPSLTGVLFIPFVKTDGTEDAVMSQGLFLPNGLEATIELPTTATATNEVEIAELQRLDDAVAATQLGLPLPE